MLSLTLFSNDRNVLLYEHTFPFLHSCGDIFCSFHCPRAVDLPLDLVHKTPCGAPRSLECPYGVLLFSIFCFVLYLDKVVKMKTPLVFEEHM